MDEHQLIRRVADLEVQVDWLRQLVDQLYRQLDVVPPSYRPPALGGQAAPTWPPPADDPIMVALARGNKIDAIKLYRERTGAGLKEAKDAVDALDARC